jgi:hypothetical protein
MERNSPRPRELAQRVIKSVKDSVAASLDTCFAFAEAWILYLEAGWTDKDILSFLSQLHAARIGPDPVTLGRDKEDRLIIGTSSASFYMMKRIGESALLKDKEIRTACLINSRSSLYDLIQFYEEACETGSGSAVKKEERAREKVLHLLTTHGDGLTRKLISEARKQLGKKRQSHKPKELPYKAPPSEGGASLAELLENGATFQEILLTPSAPVLDEIENMSIADLEERLGFQPLLTEDAVVNVVVPGDRVLTVESRFFCLRPAKYEKTKMVGSIEHMFAITGVELERDRKGFTNALKGAPDGGAVLFLSLDQSTTNPAKGLKLTTIDGIYEIGSIGNPPSDDDFALVSLGDDIYAWAVTSHGSGAGGEMASSTDFIVATGIPNLKQRKVLSFVSASYNAGGCGRAVQIACSDEKVSYRVVPGVSVPRDIELSYESKIGDKKTFELKESSLAQKAPPLTISFDKWQKKYVLPVTEGYDIMGWFQKRLPDSVQNTSK